MIVRNGKLAFPGMEMCSIRDSKFEQGQFVGNDIDLAGFLNAFYRFNTRQFETSLIPLSILHTLVFSRTITQLSSPFRDGPFWALLREDKEQNDE